MPFGQEAKEELTNLIQGKCLRILVYTEDRYGRSVGDIYCNGIFVQVSSYFNCSSFFSFFFFSDVCSLASYFLPVRVGKNVEERSGMALLGL